MSKKLQKHIYCLFRVGLIRDNANYSEPVLVPTLYYFNSSFAEHDIWNSQIFEKYRWYESVESFVFEKVLRKELEWTSIIHFRSLLTACIAWCFALVRNGRVYRIQKIEVVDKH